MLFACARLSAILVSLNWRMPGQELASLLGTDFIQQSGYLSWAEANDIILAFPQVVPGTLNPYACWDWWGYTDADYRWRNGKQMVVLTDWIKSL